MLLQCSININYSQKVKKNLPESQGHFILYLKDTATA